MASSAQERRIAVERGAIPDPVLPGDVRRFPLVDRLALWRVPGASVAVLHHGVVDWARGYGVRDAGGSEPVETDTLFQACSISKPVSAVVALRLVDQGLLELDQDVNRYLSSWKVPANGDWQPRVTLRQILCHGAGLTVHGFGGYAGDQPMPSLLQVLRGEAPANEPAIRVNAVPGAQYRYSGGGYCVLQQAVEEAAGAPFAAVARDLLFRPLGMHDSTFEQPLPAALARRAATGHRCGGGAVPGRWHRYAEQAAAGLWTTPSDLAALAAHLCAIWSGQPGLLAGATVRDMLRPQVAEHVGLGVMLDSSGEALRLHHAGDNEGFKAELVAYPALGAGAVVMCNCDEGWRANGDILRGIADVYRWPDGAGPPPTARPDGAPVAGLYAVRPGFEIEVRAADRDIELRASGQEPIAMASTGRGTFAATVVAAEVSFERDPEGRAVALVLDQGGSPLRAPRVGP